MYIIVTLTLMHSMPKYQWTSCQCKLNLFTLLKRNRTLQEERDIRITYIFCIGWKFLLVWYWQVTMSLIEFYLYKLKQIHVDKLDVEVCGFFNLINLFRNACTKSGSLRFSQFSGCWLILSVYIIMSFDFPIVRLFGDFVITLIY